jgi:hypothetical protein
MRAGRQTATIALLAAAVTLCAGNVSAHTRSQSRSTWWIDGDSVWAVFTAPVLEVTRLGEIAIADLPDAFARHLGDSIGLRSGQMPCTPTGEPVALPAETGFVRAELRFTCPDTIALALEVAPFLHVAPSHLHMADIRFAGEAARDYLFSDSVREREVRRLTVSGSERRSTSFIEYIGVGAEHMLVGWDHLAFVAVLLLLCAGPREVVFAVTGFTVGHSLTLAAAVLGWLAPSPAAVEALIGYTIAVAALEASIVGVPTAIRAAVLSATVGLVAAGAAIATHQFTVAWAVGGLILFSVCYLPTRGAGRTSPLWRVVLTAVFGLIHGLGFASVLIDMQLPPDRLVVALLGFNLGVEAGQLVVVVVLSAVAATLVRMMRGRILSLAHTATTASLLALGVFWLVSRSVG